MAPEKAGGPDEPVGQVPERTAEHKRQRDDEHSVGRVAQYPNEHTLREFEDQPDDTEEAQLAFVSALTASAVGLAATGSLDYGWNSFENGLKKGIFFNARRK